MIPNLRIAWMVPSGERVNSGDPIIRFDSSSAQQELAQKEAGLKQAQATLEQAVAQSRITAEQDSSNLADAKFTVERARLEASKQAIVSRIQGEQSMIDLGVSSGGGAGAGTQPDRRHSEFGGAYHADQKRPGHNQRGGAG